MKTKMGLTLLSSLILSACGGSGNSGSSSEDTHDHDHHDHAHTILITQKNAPALSVLEKGAAENITDLASNEANLLLSNSGQQAAIITASSVQFIAAHEEEKKKEEVKKQVKKDEGEHELPELSNFSLSGSNITVSNTIGHFSVLVDGATNFVPYDKPAAETLNLGFTETFPAVLLDEKDELVLAFNGTDAAVYEGTTKTTDSFACAKVNSVVHAGEFAVVSCDSKNYSIKIEENGAKHEVELTDLSIASAVDWVSRAGVYVGLGADKKIYVLEENASEKLELEKSFAATANMCDWAIDSKKAKIFTLTPTTLNVIEHNGSVHVSLTLDETQGATCDDLLMTPADNTVFVMDKKGAIVYEIDIEEGAAFYHIHGREKLKVTDVSSAVILHEAGQEHDHNH